MIPGWSTCNFFFFSFLPKLHTPLPFPSLCVSNSRPSLHKKAISPRGKHPTVNRSWLQHIKTVASFGLEVSREKAQCGNLPLPEEHFSHALFIARQQPLRVLKFRFSYCPTQKRKKRFSFEVETPPLTFEAHSARLFHRMAPSVILRMPKRGLQAGYGSRNVSLRSAACGEKTVKTSEKKLDLRDGLCWWVLEGAVTGLRGSGRVDHRS